ncbi:MAG: adenylyl-sulfate reductase subunit alpha [Chloroflexi bacterium]|nr:adenylyl-sulfate reductase subunit alpha [Chloroflexota bacterium]MCI0847242.1 adenylyl-sulfate reductase subunit alpha [Chloroflexota bacterium]MCI0900033.1 adenylyl-sulfate reductase subunit alpha [Chloroflexota bacterium]
MSGCGAAFESKYWSGDLRVVMVEKAVIERSGATGEGLSAINCYMGQRYGWNTPEDYTNYVVNDMMGLAREDLVYDVGRHVDNSVHLLEEWGLPIWKKDNGEYQRIGRWQIPIHGESIKPITAEPARKAIGPENLFERVSVTHLLTDADDPQKIAGAVGFAVRENKFYVFRAKAVIITCGGASNVFRPRSVGEGMGRVWYSVFATGAAYGLMIPIGTEMTQMEHRFVPTRFKDGYGPVGMWFQYFHAQVLNSKGEDYTVTRADELKKYEPYGSAIPTPTPLRNHQMFMDIKEGLGPMYMRTDIAMQKLAEGDPAKMDKVRDEAWEDFLDMTISQALTWASQNIAPEDTPTEVVLAEPYIMGSHSGEAGAWVSGPEDIATGDYFWGYNRMTTIRGLFAAGDGVGAAPHKFSSGSFTEGRIAAKAAVGYVTDNPSAPAVSDANVRDIQETIWAPLETFEKHKGASSAEEINPNFMTPKQGLVRLQKIMDEYGAGASTWYTTNEPTLLRGIELIEMFREDLTHLAARNRHELMRCWELVHRTWVGEAHLRHLLYRKETRWPGYYYRSDYPDLDDANWRVFVNSKFDAAKNSWDLQTKPYRNIITSI